MYHLLQSVYLHATSLPEYSILLLGLDAAGKTTLLNQIKQLYSTHTTTDNASGTKEPSMKAGKTVPTVGQNTSTIEIPGQLYLRIWDVGGQQTLRGLWQSYYSSCHAVVFVLDSTDVGDADISKLASMANSSAQHNEEYGRLAEAKSVLEDVLSHADAIGVPLLVLANKQDREDSVEVVRIKEGFVRRVIEGEQGDSVRDSRVLPCSALKGTGIRESVDWICSRVKWNKEARPPVMR